MNPERQEAVEIITQRVIASLKGSWNIQLDDEMRKRIYDFVDRQDVEGRIEVYFLKYIDKFDDMLYMETNHYQLRIVFMRRKRDGQKIIGINCSRTPQFKFWAFCRDHGIPDEITKQVVEKVNLKRTVLVCVCKRFEKWEAIKASEGVPVTVVEGTIVSMTTGNNGNNFSFYVLDNNVVIHLPIRKKSITWYSYEP